jgi:hypothetical protein
VEGLRVTVSWLEAVREGTPEEVVLTTGVTVAVAAPVMDGTELWLGEEQLENVGGAVDV